MTYLDELRRELDRVGIGGRLAARVVDELADHLACDPGAQLGAPRLVAERFADELGLARTRSAARFAFGSLALVAVLLVAAAGRSSYPQDLRHPRAVALSGLAIFAGAQVAFVAGVLALARGLRRSLDFAERRLVQRRTAVALGGGALTCGALLVHAIVSRPMPAAWVALMLTAGAAPVPFLAYAARGVRAAARVTPAAGRARGLCADLPGPLGRHVRAVLAAAGALAVALVAVQGTFFERSAAEGAPRAGVELAGLVVGAAVFGRLLGLFS